ncbi:AsmA-like C-terminal region-containing protein [Marinilabilia rubra]|uniref:AsmA family protein n=1 Tax=Marinilabilia rubra TaxID=2162893 RepID=A0A2U2B5J6_9BACT|nr:AsmA-like C-terminal region-containing protein [Marinilabilia rubra]PWD98337.1 AsmA family protein [Marinilabilia rubra]
MKRFFQIVLGLTALILLLLLVVPSLFKGRIEKKVTEVINENVNATVSFDEFNLSMFRYFPNLSMGLNGLTVVNKAPFEGDTLMHIGNFAASVDLWSAIGGDGIQINSVLLDEPEVWLKVNKDSVANWDIVPESEDEELEEETASAASDFSVQLELFEIRDAKVGFSDQTMAFSTTVDDLDVEMEGDLSQKATNIDVKSSIERLNLSMEGVRYLKDAFVSLDAIIGADLENMIFSFRENEFRLNDLALGFDGTLGMLEEGYELDLSLAAKETSFKTLLSMVPETYLQDFEDLTTEGTLGLEATAKGTYIDTDHLPAFNLLLDVKDGLIQYPDLPKSIRDIQITANVENPGGSMDSTVTDINKFHFQLGENPFDASLWVGTPVSNATYKGQINGVIDLASLQEAVPMDSISMKGVITANMTIDGDYEMVEKELYDEIEANGDVTIRDFLFSTFDMPAGFAISEADLQITPRFMALETFNSSFGSSDFSLSGRVENYLSYVMKDGTLEGRLNHKSKLIDTNELMRLAGDEDSAKVETDTTDMELVIVPKNLQFSLNSEIDRLVYDKLVMTNMSGGITIKDGRVILDGLRSDMLDGGMVISGEYNTADTLRPYVDFNMALNTIDVHKAANSFSMIDSMMPIARKAVGTVTTKLDFTSMIANDMSPILSSVNGGGLLNSQGVEISGAKVQSAMASMLNNDKYKKARAEDLSINFTLKNGNVIIDPFTAGIYGKQLTISGTQGLDQSLDYIIKMPVSKNELGNVAGLLGTALPSSTKDIMVDILVQGTVQDPKLKFRLDEDFKNQAAEELEKKAKEAVDEIMKDPEVKKKVDEVKNKLKDFLDLD